METERKPKKVTRDGMVAVLISPGFGAGWSTWTSEHAEMLLFDHRFVEAAEAGVTDIEPIVKQVFGKDEYIYTGGWRDISICWLPAGTAFMVNEYDGNESIVDAQKLIFVA